MLTLSKKVGTAIKETVDGCTDPVFVFSPGSIQLRSAIPLLQYDNIKEEFTQRHARTVKALMSRISD